MKPQNFTTEHTEKRFLRFKNSVVSLTPKEFILNLLIFNIFSVFSVVNFDN